jgi:hypothetical protein
MEDQGLARNGEEFLPLLIRVNTQRRARRDPPNRHENERLATRATASATEHAQVPIEISCSDCRYRGCQQQQAIGHALYTATKVTYARSGYGLAKFHPGSIWVRV